MPADVAFGADYSELKAWFSKSEARQQWAAIKFSEFNGAEFDTHTMAFKERE